VRHYKPQNLNGIQEQNSQCASALYVPLLHSPCKTTNQPPAATEEDRRFLEIPAHCPARADILQNSPLFAIFRTGLVG
jgi:hypothetical protein